MQDYYHQLLVRPSSHHELFRDFLSDTLPVGFEECDDAFIVRSEDDLETIAWGIEQFTEALQRALGTTIDIDLELSKEMNEDWVKAYQKGVSPVQVSSFYIHPTWEAPKEGAVNIALDPALAFGTGHHPTTATCLMAIERYVQNGDDVIDVGCGSGILGIAAAKLGAHVDACDTDPVSIANTAENCEQNAVRFGTLWEGSVAMAPKEYDVVIANIVADVLVMIAKDLKKALKPGGRLILSGIMDKYEEKVLSAYKDFPDCERITEAEWVTLVLQKETANEK